VTIPKHTHQAKAAIASAKDVRCYSLSNNFSGEPLTEQPVVWGGEVVNNCYTKLIPVTRAEFLSRELRGRNVTLSEHGGRYTLRVHSNLWYEW
jgi:hypothetical protein